MSRTFATAGHFVNDEFNVVSDTLAGAVLTNPYVAMFDFAKVIVVRNYLESHTVRILSGGASGHEPSFFGFVGKGMLTAAIQGDIFLPPTMTDILRTIRQLDVQNDYGLLVIIQNSTGDLLNFGLAVERAQNKGVAVKLLVVAEDCCSVDYQKSRRGLTGILLIQKIAGSMAESGNTLDEIYTFCSTAQEHMTSILFSLAPCCAPNEERCICKRQMYPSELEIGTGIHGQPCTERIMNKTAKENCILLLEKISTALAIKPEVPIVVLINNLGASLPLEEYIVLKEFLSLLLEKQFKVARVFHGHFYTVLDMRGFSITVLNVFDDKLLKYVDDSCEASAWINACKTNIAPDLLTPLQGTAKLGGVQTKGYCLTEIHANIVLLVVQFCCDALISCEKQINVIHSEQSTGNMGTRLKEACETILQEIKKKTLDYQNMRTFFQALSIISEKVIMGTMGFAYSILFEAASNYFRKLSQEQELTADVWVSCFKDAVVVLANCFKPDFEDGTFFVPLQAFAAEMEKSLNEGCDSMNAFGVGVSAAEDAAIHTRKITERYADPGAHIVGIWMRAAYEGAKMRLGD